MRTISKKHRDAAMRCIIDFYASSNGHSYISTEYLTSQKAVPNSVDPKQVVNVLASMGYIIVKKDILGNDSIQLTPEGRCYFETESDDTAETRRQHLHDWLIAIFSALVGAILSEPIWSLIHALVDQLRG